MKNVFNALIVLLLLTNCSQKTKSVAVEDDSLVNWGMMDKILAEIKAPTFPDKVFDVVNYGVEPNTDVDSKEGIQKAIDETNANGGGKVLIKAGNYKINGSLYLKSNVNLHIEEGATLFFSTTPTDYLPLVLTRWEGVDCYNYSALIYANGQENIGLTGKGILDGQSSEENWWPWAGKGYGFEKGMPSQMDENCRPKLYDLNTREVPVEERRLGEGSYLRPNFYQPYNCTNVLLEGVTFKNSPMWIIHPVLSENITIKDVTVISHGPNSDGCDPESCKNVLIDGCFFDTGDDCIALKSGRNQDGRNTARPIENVIVRNCIMKDGHGGVVIGSEVSGGARNIFAENCEMDSPNLDRALRIKTNKIRGGTIENLFFRNITVGEVREAVLRVNMRYPIYSNPEQEYIPVIRNIHVENVTSKKSKFGIMIDGYDETHTVDGVHIKNCQFNGVERGNDIEFGSNFNFSEFYINNEHIVSTQ